MTKRSMNDLEPIVYPPDFEPGYSAWADGEDNVTRAALDASGEPASMSLAYIAEESGRAAAVEAIAEDGFDAEMLSLSLKASWRLFADGIEHVTRRERNEAAAWYRVAFWLEIKRATLNQPPTITRRPTLEV